MRIAATLLLFLAVLPAVAPAVQETVPTPASTAGPPDVATAPPRLAMIFFTESFLAEAVTRIEADRTERERLAGGYLQEKTGLIWARSDNGADVDWYGAADYCDALEIADWDDWRTPTIDELEALHVRRSNDLYKVPPAIRLTGCCPWSSSPSGDGSAWNFSFRYRKPFSGSLNYSYELRALCVRAASAEDVLFFERAAEEEKLEARRKRRGRAEKRRS